MHMIRKRQSRFSGHVIHLLHFQLGSTFEAGTESDLEAFDELRADLNPEC